MKLYEVVHESTYFPFWPNFQIVIDFELKILEAIQI
jgi:hypothetical protein